MDQPVLTKYVREPNCYTLDFYVKHARLRGSAQGARTQPNDIIEQVKASGLRGRGGAGFPTGMKWQFVHKDTPKPKYIALQRRRERAGHVQGSRADGAQPAPADRRVRDRLLCDRREGRLHLHPRRVLSRAAGPRGARSRRRTARAISARTSSAAGSTATSTCIAAPAPTKRARRRRSSNRSKASAPSRASSRRFRRSRASTVPDRREQRRDAVQRPADHRPTARSGSPSSGPRRTAGRSSIASAAT